MDTVFIPGEAKRKPTPIRAWRSLLALVATLGCAGCDIVNRGFLNPQGPVAMAEKHLFLEVCFVMLFVIGPVLLLVPVFAWHYRLANTKNAYRPSSNITWPLELLIWIPPALIVMGLSVLLWHRARQLDPYLPLGSKAPALEVQAVALNWKWLFIYPGSNVATINQLAIPVGGTVHISLTSGTVMQSLLIPQLAGQIYAMAGMVTQLNLEADVPGRFTGQNTQYNGEGFAQDRFAVLAMPAQDYDQWLARLRSGHQPLDANAFQILFKNSVQTQPVFFSSVEPALFQRILAHSAPSSAMADGGGHP